MQVEIGNYSKTIRVQKTYSDYAGDILTSGCVAVFRVGNAKAISVSKWSSPLRLSRNQVPKSLVNGTIVAGLPVEVQSRNYWHCFPLSYWSGNDDTHCQKLERTLNMRTGKIGGRQVSWLLDIYYQSLSNIPGPSGVATSAMWQQIMNA